MIEFTIGGVMLMYLPRHHLQMSKGKLNMETQVRTAMEVPPLHVTIVGKTGANVLGVQSDSMEAVQGRAIDAKIVSPGDLGI